MGSKMSIWDLVTMMTPPETSPHLAPPEPFVITADQRELALLAHLYTLAFALS